MADSGVNIEHNRLLKQKKTDQAYLKCTTHFADASKHRRTGCSHILTLRPLSNHLDNILKTNKNDMIQNLLI